jgi:hypothetical protein
MRASRAVERVALQRGARLGAAPREADGRAGPCRLPLRGRRGRQALHRNRRRALQAHHVVPPAAGGADELANLAAVCRRHQAALEPH